MPYIIRKSSRIGTMPYGNPYTCAKAGVPVGKVYNDKEEGKAELDARLLGEANPVGFHVISVRLVEQTKDYCPA